MQEIDNNIFI